MKKVIVSLFIMFSTIFSFTYVSASEYISTFLHMQQIDGEKDALSELIVKEHPKNVTQSSAKLIVDTVYEMADTLSINPVLLVAMIKHESGFNKNAKSPYGAKGLLQVVPRFHKDKLNGRNPFNAGVSIEVGAKIFSDCLTKHKSNTDKALRCYSGNASYNAKIKKTHDRMRREIVVLQFQRENMISLHYSFNKPKVVFPQNAKSTNFAYAF